MIKLRQHRSGLMGAVQLLLLASLITSCSVRPPSIPGFPGSQDSAPARRLDPNSIRDAVPKSEQQSRRGNPRSYVVMGKRYSVMPSSRGYRERGIASWYGTKFHGRSTSSGEPYDMYAMTAAHKSLPLPTYVEVTNLRNGLRTIVKVNDRGPFHGNRIIDLSYAAATKLGILGHGTGLVEVRAIDPGYQQPKPRPVTASVKPVQKADPDLFIQVGSFSSRENALRLMERLEQSLSQVIRIQQATHSGTQVFRVQIGPLASIGLSDLLHEKLAYLGIANTHIVIE